MEQEQAQRRGGKKVIHGPSGLNCQYKPSSGESFHRPLAEQWKETYSGGNIVPSRLLPHYIYHAPPLDYLNPDNTCASRYSYAKFTSPPPGSLTPPPFRLSLSLNSSLFSHPFLLPHLRSGWDAHNKSSLQILTATLNPGSALASRPLHINFLS